MTEAEILTEVKNILRVTGDFQDAALNAKIKTTKVFLRGAGVPEKAFEDGSAVGCIAQLVNDIDSYASGEVKLSEFTKMQIAQLAAGG